LIGGAQGLGARLLFLGQRVGRHFLNVHGHF
jgi:hypothetical protein